MKKIPFYANTKDDNHCVEAAIKIILKYFWPDKEFNYQNLDKLTEKVANKGTWWPPVLINLAKMGMKVKVIETFDYQQFKARGRDYVLSHFGPVAGKWYLENSNLMEIRASIPEFLDTVDFECRPASRQDIKRLLAEGWIIGLELNSRRLHNLDGFVAHTVVVYDFKNDKFFIHDPGLPPRPSLEISVLDFEKIWLDKNVAPAALFALKA